MKKKFAYLFILFILLLPVCIVKADGKTLVSNVVATSNIDSLLVYGSDLETPTFTVTDGVQAHVDTSEFGWYKYENNKWMRRSNGYPLSSGKWQFRAKLIIDGDYASSYILGNQTTFKVNDVNWTYSYRSTLSNSDTSVAYVYSPEYNIDVTGEFEFFAHEKYRIYRTYINEAAYPISVADGVEGGTAPFTFEKVSGPAWLTVSSIGEISGTPTEVGNNSDLVVRATDALNNSKEITIPVEKTILPPGLREVITAVDATSNTSTIPVLNGELTTPTFTMTHDTPAVFELYAGGWYKKVGNRWELMTGTFTPGLWHYRTHVAVVDEAGENYMLNNDTVVTIDGRDWGFAVDGYSNEYVYGWVTSEDYLIKSTIDSVVLDSSFKAPKVGDDITDPTIWQISVNGDNNLVGLVEVTAKWQYKTGDGFYDWEDATGKFEANKTYHINLMITMNSDYYDFKNIANYPVTLDGYELIQYQLNTQTVGEFIEFPMLKALTVPVIKLTADNNQLKLTWDNQELATKYQIFRSIDGKTYTKLNEVTKNKYTNKSLDYGKTYYYKVKACNGSKCTDYSNVVKKKVVPNKVNLSISSAGTTNIKIKYDKVSTTGYQVYMGTKTTNMSLIKDITSNSTLTYNKTGLKTNKTYYFKVRAYKTFNGKKIYGSWSAIVSTKTAPVKPTVKLTLKSIEAMNIKIGEAKGATKYVIQKSTNGKSYTTVDELTKYGTKAQTGLTLGKTYYFRVRACNSQNRCSGWVVVKLKHTPKAPSFSLTTTSKKVTITLKNVTGVDGYEIYRSTSKDGTYTKIKTIKSGGTLEYTKASTKGTTYYYKVRSYKAVGTKTIYSPYSSIKNIISK